MANDVQIVNGIDFSSYTNMPPQWDYGIYEEITKDELAWKLNLIKSIIRMRAKIRGINNVPFLTFEYGPFIYLLGNPQVTDYDEYNMPFTRPHICIETKPMQVDSVNEPNSIMMPILMPWLLARVKVTDRVQP